MNFRKQFVYKEIHCNKNVDIKFSSNTTLLTTEDLMNTWLKKMPIFDRVDNMCGDSDTAVSMDRIALMAQFEELLKSEKLCSQALVTAVTTFFYSKDEKLGKLAKAYLMRHFKNLNSTFVENKVIPSSSRPSLYLLFLSILDTIEDTSVDIYNLTNFTEMVHGALFSEYGSLMNPNSYSKMLIDVMKIGPRMTSSPDLCREMFIAAMGRKLNCGQIGRILTYLISDGSDSPWDIQLLIDLMRKEMGVLDWNGIMRSLDNGFLNISSEVQYKRLCAVLGQGCVAGVLLSSSNVFAEWSNTKMQFIMINKFIERRDLFDIVSYSKVLPIDSMKMPFSDHARKNIVWGCVDMVCCLLRMYRRMEDAVRDMFTYPMEYCPDLLFTSLTYCEAVDWMNRLKMGLMVAFMKVIARNKGLRMYLHHAMTLGDDVVWGIGRAVEFAALSNPQLFESIYIMTCNVELLHGIRFSPNIPFNFQYNRYCHKHDEHFTPEGWFMLMADKNGLDILEKLIRYAHGLAYQTLADVPQEFAISRTDKFMNIFLKGALRVSASREYQGIQNIIKELFMNETVDQPPRQRTFPKEDPQAVEKAKALFSTLKSSSMKVAEFAANYIPIYNLTAVDDDYSRSFIHVFMTLLKDEVFDLHRCPLSLIETLVNIIICIYTNKLIFEPQWSDILNQIRIISASTEERKFHAVVATNYILTFFKIFEAGFNNYIEFTDYLALIMERTVCLEFYPQAYIPLPSYVVTECLNNLIKQYGIPSEFLFILQEVTHVINMTNLAMIEARIMGSKKYLSKNLTHFLAYYIVNSMAPTINKANHSALVQLVLCLDRRYGDSKEGICLYSVVIDETSKYRIDVLSRVNDNFKPIKLSSIGHWIGCLTISIELPLCSHIFDVLRMSQLLYTFPPGPLLNAHVVIILEILKCSKYSETLGAPVFSLPNAFVMTVMKLLMLLQVKGRVTATVGLEIDSVCIILSNESCNLLDAKAEMTPDTELFDAEAILYVRPLQLAHHSKLTEMEMRHPRYRPGTLNIENFTLWKTFIVLDEFINYEPNLKKQLIMELECIFQESAEYFIKHVFVLAGESIDAAVERVNKCFPPSNLQGVILHSISRVLGQFYNIDPDTLISLSHNIISVNWRLFDDMLKNIVKYSLKAPDRQPPASRQNQRMETDRSQLIDTLSGTTNQMECSEDIKTGLKQLVSRIGGANLHDRADMIGVLRMSIHCLFVYFDPNKISPHDVTTINQFMITLFSYLFKDTQHYQVLRDTFLRLLWEEDDKVRRNLEATLFCLANFIQISEFDEYMANSLMRGDVKEYSYMINLDKFLGMATNPPVRPLLKSMAIVKKYQEIPSSTVELDFPSTEPVKPDVANIALVLITKLLSRGVNSSMGYAAIFEICPDEYRNDLTSDHFLPPFVISAFTHCEEFITKLTLKFGQLNHTLYESVFFLADCLSLFLSSLVAHRQSSGLSAIGVARIMLCSFASFICNRKSAPLFFQRFLMSFFRNLFCILEGPDINYVMMILSRVLEEVQPIFLDCFAFSVVSMMSNRMLVIRYLNTLPDHWILYSAILGNCLKYTRLFTSEYIPPLAIYYKMICELLHMLVRDRPEFLSHYYMHLVSHINVNAHQLFQYVTSAQPRDITTAEIRDRSKSPHIMIPTGIRIGEKMKQQLDTFLSDRKPVIILTNLKDALLGTSGSSSGMDFTILNWVVLYVGLHAVKSLDKSQRIIDSIAYTPHTDIFQHLLIHFDYQGKFLLVVSLLNHVRYPSRHTEYFTSLIIHLYLTCDTVRDLIILVLLKRMIVYKPHSVGFMELFVKLTSPEVLNQPSNKQLSICLDYYREICQPSNKQLSICLDYYREICQLNLNDFYSYYQSDS